MQFVQRSALAAIVREDIEAIPFQERSALAAIVREDIEAIPFQDGQCNSFFEESAARIVERTMPPKGIPFGL